MSTHTTVTSKKVTFAIFGLGRAGSIHANNIIRHPEAQLKYIVEPRIEHAQAWVKEHELEGQVTVVGSDKTEEVLADPEVQAAMVASLTSTHEEIIRACFKHQKPVFSEKPIAATVEATVAVCNLSESTGVPLLCGFNRRSDAQFIELKARLDAGDVGRLMMIKSTSYDYPTNCPIEYIKVSGGQLVDQSVHDMDIVLMLAGELPSSVYAIGHAFYPDIAELNDTDTVCITLKFPSGVMGTIDNTRRALFGYDTRCEVLGDKGQLLLENLRPKNVVLNNVEGQHHSRIYDHFNTRFATAYNSELSHFIDYLKGRVDRLRITPAEAAAAVRVSMAAAESLKTGAPVQLDWSKK